MDVKLLTWFASTKAPFAMEVASRTDADKKGGHLARSKNGGPLRTHRAQALPAAARRAPHTTVDPG
eukprot:2497452-Prymnesium_polylepis.1